MNDRDRLAFACELASTTLDDGFERGRWELRLKEFFEGDGSQVRGVPVEWNAGWQRREKLTVERDWTNLRNMASALVDAATNRKGTWKGVRLSYAQDLIAVGPGGAAVLIRGTVASTFARVLTAAVLTEGLGRFQRCEKCDQPFIRGRADQKLCRFAECKRERQNTYFQKYAGTPKGRRARRRQLESLKQRIKQAQSGRR
jgi:hypothetical protein